MRAGCDLPVFYHTVEVYGLPIICRDAGDDSAPVILLHGLGEKGKRS